MGQLPAAKQAGVPKSQGGFADQAETPSGRFLWESEAAEAISQATDIFVGSYSVGVEAQAVVETKILPLAYDFTVEEIGTRHLTPDTGGKGAK